MVRLIFSLVVALFALLPSAHAAQNMQVALIAESRTPQAGKDLTVAIHMTPARGWHGYWLNTGDAGLPDRIRWQLPDGFTISPLSYPVPGRLIVAGMMNYVYDKPYALLGRLSVPESFKPGTTANITADIDYLVCSDTLCVPEKASISLSLTAGDGAISSSDQARFDQFRSALPKPLGNKADFAVSDSKLQISIPFAGSESIEEAYFYPTQRDLLVHNAAQRQGVDANHIVVEAELKPTSNIPQTISGVLTVKQNGNVHGFAIEAEPGVIAPPQKWLDQSSSATNNIQLIILSFLAAVAGGLILNAMPCVFPILSLKALSLIKSGDNNPYAKRESLAYSLGVILSCVALGGILLGLREAGLAVGWAFQLQNPLITFGLLLLVMAIALNLAGMFNLPTPSFQFSRKAKASAPIDNPTIDDRASYHQNMTGAFGTGVLAAVIATPCTGPFMGAALGSALILPAPAALGIFAGLGLGLALPFILLAYIPSLRKRLPRPGPWMETFRNILSVPMFLTAVGLAWVLGRQAGINAMGIAILSTALVSLSLWWIGRRQITFKSIKLALLSLILAIALPFILLLNAPTATNTAPDAELVPHAADIAFDEQALAELRAQGTPVFLYFGADWCLICQVNEKSSINRASTRAHFAARSIVAMQGDWTNGDPKITRFLERFGRSGVPFYLYYPTGSTDPQILPQLLTPALLEALK